MSKKNVDKNATTSFKHVFCAENPGRIDDFYDMDTVAIGEGSYGRVCKGVDKTTKQVRAIKAIASSKITDPKRFDDEMRIQQKLDHPNIVKLYEVFKDAKTVYLVMECCTGGELFDRIIEECDKHDNHSAFTENDAAKVMSQIMEAMRYMHASKFVHRDIKPENFIMQNKEKNSPVKVIDFGLAKHFEHGNGKLMDTKAGTPYYVAPQVLKGKYDEKCDIWSCGVVLYIVICGSPPFAGNTDSQILKKVAEGKVRFPSPDWDKISGGPNGVKDLITKMLKFAPTERYSAAQCLEHPWLKSRGLAHGTSTPIPGLSKNLNSFVAASKLKKVALTVMAQIVSEDDIRDLKETFLALDVNHDGTLTPAEIAEGIQKMGISEKNQDLAESLKKIDTDSSGSIDYSEFIAASLERSTYLKRDNMWRAFRLFDRDGDGKITGRELGVILEDHPKDTVRNIITQYDLDGDGVIEFEEFMKMMEAK